MSGIEMLLKSFGFDPEAIKTQVTEFQGNLAKLLANFDQRLVAIENRLITLEAQNLLILEKVTEDPAVFAAGPSRIEESHGPGNSSGTDSS